MVLKHLPDFIPQIHDAFRAGFAVGIGPKKRDMNNYFLREKTMRFAHRRRT
jgi:hypothetical protein